MHVKEETKIMKINFTHNHQFQSLLNIPQSSSKIELCFETKLLGYWLTIDMKPHKHVKHVLKISYSKVWSISRLKCAEVSDKDIFHFYTMKIRSVLEYSAPVFTSMLTQQDIHDIERIQKIVIKAILQHRYSDYHQGCLLLGIEDLDLRRTRLCLKFGLKAISNNKFKELFSYNTNVNIRNPDKFDLPLARSSRYFNSPLLYITRLLNSHFRVRN